MAFFPNTNHQDDIGKTICLLEDVQVLKGLFTAGHIMTITGITSRGYDLIDEDGNTMTEFGFWSKFKFVDLP